MYNSSLDKKGQNAQFTSLKMPHYCTCVEQLIVLHTQALLWWVVHCWICLGDMSGETESGMEKRHCAGVGIDPPSIQINVVWLTHLQPLYVQGYTNSSWLFMHKMCVISVSVLNLICGTVYIWFALRCLLLIISSVSHELTLCKCSIAWGNWLTQVASYLVHFHCQVGNAGLMHT